jgi:ArsR family metal-binding transcriptional regulator
MPERLEIAINALQDEDGADKMLRWLQEQINETWEGRAEISQTLETAPGPQILPILRLLPRTNCGRCGQNTCAVFAALMTEGAKGPEDCPLLDVVENRKVLMDYLARFHLLP